MYQLDSVLRGIDVQDKEVNISEILMKFVTANAVVRTVHVVLMHWKWLIYTTVFRYVCVNQECHKTVDLFKYIQYTGTRH